MKYLKEEGSFNPEVYRMKERGLYRLKLVMIQDMRQAYPTQDYELKIRTTPAGICFFLFIGDILLRELKYNANYISYFFEDNEQKYLDTYDVDSITAGMDMVRQPEKYI